MDMVPSNSTILSNDNRIRANKKRQKQNQIQEVVFDEVARREFLTGFRKRNLEKKEAAKKKAEQREKEERLQERKERRRELAERAKANQEEVEKAYGGASSIKGAEALHDPDAKGKAKEEVEVEYENEDQVATVTVVEDLDIYDLDDMGVQTQRIGDSPSRSFDIPDTGRKVSIDMRRQSSSKKSKPKKVKYETKAARQATKMKERKRKLEKAVESRSRKRNHGSRKR